MTEEDMLDELAEAISDSLDVDWQPRDGARAVIRCLRGHGLFWPVRGTECPSSHDGRHHVDTSMESGPNNCFHCEADMRTAASLRARGG